MIESGRTNQSNEGYMKQPIIHFHDELLKDTGEGLITDVTINKWFKEGYSTSKHLWTLYSIAVGTGAKSILEIGFGRSTFILARAAAENKGLLTTCDVEDYSHLLSKEESKYVKYTHGYSNEIWSTSEKYDLAFLDYYSSEKISVWFCIKELKRCLNMMTREGLIIVHDTYVHKYSIRKAIKYPKPFT